MNQPIRVQPEVKAEGQVQHSVALLNSKRRYNTTCTRRVQIDAQENRFSSTPGHFLLVLSESLQVESVMQNKGVVQNVMLSDVMRLLFNLRFQVFFVCQDVPVPLGDGLILTHPDLLSNLKGKQNNCNNDGQLLIVIKQNPQF